MTRSKETRKRIFVVISSLIVWALSENLIKAPMAHLLRPWFQNFGEGPNILAGICFAYVHTQYPLEIRIYVGIVGMIFSWAFLRTKNFAAPVLAHCIADWILDSIFK